MNSCIACGSANTRKDGELEGYIQGSHYEIFSCQDCKTKWSAPHTVDTAVYEYIYANKSDTPGYIRYAQFAEDVMGYAKPLNYLASQENAYYGVVSNIPKQGRILEVGCGLGYFTYALAKSGYTAIGIDVSKKAIDDAEKRYGKNLFRHENFFNLHVPEAEKFDAIIMIEVIEHVEDPGRYLEHAKKLLKKDGRVIVTTPNRSWYGDDVFWASDLPPVHLTWFSKTGMAKLAESYGYKASFSTFGWFNVLYGTILGPSTDIKLNPPFFSKDGKLLFEKFQHSQMYYLTRKYGVYRIIKRAQSIKNKLKEVFVVLMNPKRLSVKDSTCMCVTMTIN